MGVGGPTLSADLPADARVPRYARVVAIVDENKTYE